MVFFLKVTSLLVSKSRAVSNNWPRGHPSGAANQARVLRAEGVTVTTGSLGELMIDLVEYGWFPRQLPSDAAAGLDTFVDSDEEG